MTIRLGWAVPAILAVLVPVPPASAQQHIPQSEIKRKIASLDKTNWPLVIQFCDEAIRINPKDANAYGERAHALFELSQYANALADLDRAIALKPTSARWLTERGIVHVERGDWEKGLWEFDRAIDADPNYAPAYYHRGSVWVEQKQWDRARCDLNEAVRLDPDSLEYRYSRASLRLREKEWLGAIEDLNRAIELDPKDYRSFAGRGGARGELGQWEEAIADLDKALALEPRLPQAFTMRGAVRGKLRQFENAIADLDKALEIDPEHVQALNNRAACWLELKQIDKLISDLDQVIALEPTPTVYRERGSAYGFCNKLDLAIRDLNKAIDLDDSVPQAFYNRGICRRRKSQYKEALADFSRAIELEPRKVLYLRARIDTLLELERYDAALSDVKTILENNPKEKQAFKSRACIWVKKKELDKAILDLERAQALDPNDPWTKNALSQCTKRKQEVAKWWNRPVATRNWRIDPLHPEAEVAKSMGRSKEDHAVQTASYYTLGISTVREEKAKAKSPIDGIKPVESREITQYLTLGAYEKDQGNWESALGYFDLVLKLSEGHSGALILRAWIRAACPEAKFRDVQKAIADAQGACKITAWKDGAAMEALAAAYAEKGNFDEAVKWQQKALEAKADQKKAQGEMEKRLKRYRAKKPARLK